MKVEQDREFDQSFFSLAPESVLLNILNFLNYTDLLTTRLVNTNLKVLCDDRSVWQTRLSVDFNLVTAVNFSAKSKYFINVYVASALFCLITGDEHVLDYAKKAANLLNEIVEDNYSKEESGWKLYMEGILDCIKGNLEGYQKILQSATKHQYCEALIIACFMGNDWDITKLPIFTDTIVLSEHEQSRLIALKISNNKQGFLGRLLLSHLNLDDPTNLLQQHLYTYKILPTGSAILAKHLQKNYHGLISNHAKLDIKAIVAYDPSFVYLQQLRRYKEICDSNLTENEKTVQKFSLAEEGCSAAACDLQQQEAINSDTFRLLIQPIRNKIADRIIALYQQAHEVGINEASIELALILTLGLNDFESEIQPNPQRAKQILQTCILRGQINAYYYLGTLDLPDITVTKQAEYLQLGITAQDQQCIEYYANLMIKRQFLNLADVDSTITSAMQANRVQNPNSLLVLANAFLTGDKQAGINQDTVLAVQFYDRIIEHNPNETIRIVKFLWQYQHYIPAIARLLLAVKLHQGASEMLALQTLFNTGAPYSGDSTIKELIHPEFSRRWNDYMSTCLFKTPKDTQSLYDELARETVKFAISNRKM